MYKNKKICVVVPAYNEEKLIEKTIRSVPDYVDRIIVIDDASTDNTSIILEKLKESISNLMIIRHDINKGVGGAIITGYEKSVKEDIDISVVMAGDAQMNPKNIPRLLEPIINGSADYVKGNRLLTSDVREIMPGIRYLGNSLLTILTKIASGYWNIMDPQCGYTAISKDTIKRIYWNKLYQRYGFENELLIEMNINNIRIKDVFVDPVYGTEKSKIKLTSFIPTVSIILLKGFFRRLKEKYIIRDFHPLIFFYFLGIVSSIIGIILSIWIIYHRFFIKEIISAPTVILCALLLITGLHSIFFAMWFDMEYNKYLKI